MSRWTKFRDSVQAVASAPIAAISPKLAAPLISEGATAIHVNIKDAAVGAARQSTSFATGGIIGGDSGVVDFSSVQPGWVKRLGATGTNSLQGGFNNDTLRKSAAALTLWYGGGALLGEGGATAGATEAAATGGIDWAGMGAASADKLLPAILLPAVAPKKPTAKPAASANTVGAAPAVTGKDLLTYAGLVIGVLGLLKGSF